MPSFVVVGFYTVDTPYEQEIKKLVASCHEHGVHCHVRGYQNRGSWVKNASIKPSFILEMMELHPGKKIVYLDADARIRQYPKLFDELDVDIAIHYRYGRELLSGTLFLGPGSKDLVRKWAVAQDELPEVWDQKVLQALLQEWKQPLRVARLPATYCQIFDTMRGAGDPIIEHMQASRRYKQLVTIEAYSDVPHVYEGCRIRRAPDGSYWISKSHKRTEAFLDEYCIRVPGTLRWSPHYKSNNCHDDLCPTFKDKLCYIVGKGPSLDSITRDCFKDPDAPIFALNESIFKVEALDLPNPLYALQQDAKLKDTCLPKRESIFVSMKAANYYAHSDRVYIFQNTELGLHPNALSVSAAIMLAKRLGSSKLELLCFDACVDGRLGYAKCIAQPVGWGGAADRFLSHKIVIEKNATGIPLRWTTPGDLA